MKPDALVLNRDNGFTLNRTGHGHMALTSGLAGFSLRAHRCLYWLGRVTAVALLAALVVTPQPAAAQGSRYVSDDVFIVLHAGPGVNYRWLGKLNPGTALTELQQSEDGGWSEVRTQRGTVGWVQAEFIASEPPAQVRLPVVTRQLEDAEREAAASRSTATKLTAERDELRDELERKKSELQQVTEELAQLRQISGSAVETAKQNRRLVEESTNMQMNLDTLEADNQRLQERVQSGAFLDGAFAVALGVFIALVVPRLWPKRRSSSSWA